LGGGGAPPPPPGSAPGYNTLPLTSDGTQLEVMSI
jgi:hypothetical protein